MSNCTKQPVLAHCRISLGGETMSYCNNCGTKIEKDDLFCPNCGTKVNQGKNGNQNKEGGAKEFTHVNSITNQINFAEIINTLKNSVISPVSGGKQFVAKSERNQVIFITIILTLLQGILGIWRINQIFSSLHAISMKFLDNLSSLASLVGEGSTFNSGDLESLDKTINQFKSFIKMPYGKVFIQNCGLYLIGIFLLFILIYLFTSILIKANCTPFAVFKTVLISTLPILTCEIISIIFSYFSLYLGIGFAILGALISITTLTILVKDSLQIKENLCIVIVSISFLIALVVSFIALQKFISSDLSDIIKSTINSYKNSPFNN
jgi:uncharacterized Zn finger protein (UPF0148 family)